MSFNEDINNLRVKLSEAVESGFMDAASKGTYEVTLIQILNESERQRQNCHKRAEVLKMQASTAEGQSAAFSMISSIVHNVVTSLIKASKKPDEEDKEQEDKEQEDKEQEDKVDKNIPKKRSSKKRSVKK